MYKKLCAEQAIIIKGSIFFYSLGIVYNTVAMKTAFNS